MPRDQNRLPLVHPVVISIEARHLCCESSNISTSLAHFKELRHTQCVLVYSVALSHTDAGNASPSSLPNNSNSLILFIMSALDVEALLDSTATVGPLDQNGSAKLKDADDRHRGERNDRRDRDRTRDNSRDRDRDRKRSDRSRDKSRREINGEKELIGTPTSDQGSTHGSVKSRRRSRSRDDERRHSRRYRDSPNEPSRRDGDFYRGGGRMRSRSRSPNRYYRPRGDRRDRDDVDAKPRDDRRSRRSSRSPKRETTPPLTEDERDRRTVFVQQLAARLRTKELIAFFEKVGPVKEAQIVKDRVSGRSKGYVFIQISCTSC